MFDHKCTIVDAYVPVEYQFVDSGIFINVRRVLHRITMVDPQHPMTLQYFKSSNMRRREMIRHISNHPLLIHPFSMVALYWEFIYFGVYTFITTVIFVTLMDQEHIVTRILTLCKRSLDIFVFLDIIKNFLTGYYHREKYGTIMKPNLLSKHYLQSYFFIDLLPITSSMMVLIKNFIIDNEAVHEVEAITIYFNILRIFRLKRCSSALNLWRFYFKLSTNVSGIGIVLYKYFMIILWLYQVAYYLDIMLTDYVLDRPSRSEVNGVLNTFLGNTRLLLHCTYGLSYLFEPVDILVSGGLVCVSYGLHLYLYSQVQQAFRRFINAQAQNDQLLTQFKTYVRYKGLPLAIREKFFEFFSFKYQNAFFNESVINEILPKKLRQQIQLHVSREHIRTVDFLKRIPQYIVRELVIRMKSEIYLPNDIIVHAGIPGNCMYFIYYGTVAVYAPSGIEMCHLKDGSHFGEIALLFNEPRVATVVATTACELFVLKKTDFDEVFSFYPGIRDDIFRMANERVNLVKRSFCIDETDVSHT